MPKFLEVKQLTLDRNRKTILTDVSFRVEKHSILMIIGPSGAGKSTLLRTINRLLEPPEKTIFLENRDIITLPVLQLRQRIGMVFQKPVMFEGTVAKNISFGPTLIDKTLSPERTRELLAAVSLNHDIAGDLANQLSEGQSQRVALARTLATQPDLILLDEPTSALDPFATKKVEETLLNLNSMHGITLLWVSHSIEQTRRIGKEVLLMKGGKVIDLGPVETVLDPYGPHKEAIAFASGEDPNQ